MASSSTKRLKTRASKPPSKGKRPAMGLQHPLDEEINLFESKKGSTAPKTTLAKPHYLVANEIVNTRVYELLEFQGWIDFLKQPLSTKPSLVHWFYRYFKTELSGDYVPTLNLFVNMPDGSKLGYNHDDFLEDFGLVGDVHRVDDHNWNSRAFTDYELTTWPVGLRRLDIRDFDGVTTRLNNLHLRDEVTEWLAGSVVLDGLTGDDKLLLKIVKGLVLPCNSNDNSISHIHGVILCMLRERVKINLPVLILKHIQQAPTNKQAGTLPYGGLITHIVRRWGIAPEGDEPEIPAAPINCTTYRRQQSILLGRRLIQAWEEPHLTEEERAAYAVLVREKSRRRATARRARGAEAQTQAQDQEQDTDTEEGALRPGVSVELADRVERVERRQGRMMRLLKIMAEKMGCTHDDVELASLSPEE